MRKFITNMFLGVQDELAIVKPKNDVTSVAIELGFEPLMIRYFEPKEETPDITRARIDGVLSGVSAGDIVVFQYPTFLSADFDLLVVEEVKKIGAKLVVFVHDSQELRFRTRPHEIDLFNMASALIVHNAAMAVKFSQMGVRVPMVQNHLFPYFVNGENKSVVGEIEPKLVYAGNLSKAEYLDDWAYQTPITAFGVDTGKLSSNVNYCGSFVPDELARQIPVNTLGLVWDVADDEDGNDYGEYTRFNQPYKLSMYFALGMPVVVWAKSAVAELVIKNNLGLALVNLDDLDASLANLNHDDLVQMQSNVAAIRDLVLSGYSTKQALLEIQNKVSDVPINFE